MALQVWGINIHDTWGSVEIGLAAAEGESFSGMTLAEDFLVFKAVDAGNRPAADRARAEKVLVTKLYGSVMPLIRYELTDSLVIDPGPNPDAPGCRLIREVKGRSDDWFVYSGSIRIHPMSFRGVLGQDPHVSEYQVQQTPDGARILAIVHGRFHRRFSSRHLFRPLPRPVFSERGSLLNLSPNCPAIQRPTS